MVRFDGVVVGLLILLFPNPSPPDLLVLLQDAGRQRNRRGTKERRRSDRDPPQRRSVLERQAFERPCGTT